METKTYKIVFSGDLAFDTDAEEVRASLAEKCGYSPSIIDKILGSTKITLQKGLSLDNANRYKNFYDQLGLMCDMLSEQENLQPAPLLRQAPVKQTKPTGKICPKCGASDQSDTSCSNCGIIFERFEKARSRRYNSDLEPEAVETTAFATDPLWQKLLQQPSAQMVLMIVLIMLFRGPFHTFLLAACAILVVGAIAYILFQASETGDSALDIGSNFIAIWPEKLHKGETPLRDRPLMTCALAYAPCILYLVIRLAAPAALSKLSFLPVENTLVTSICTYFLAPLLHLNAHHLWFNMIILWLLACHIEIAQGRKLLTYFVAAALIPQTVYVLAAAAIDLPPHVLGSSALVAALLGGVIALQPKSFIESSLPLFSPLTSAAGFSFKIEIKPILLLGLFFLVVTGGTPEATEPFAGLYPLTGLICGYLAGLLYPVVSRKK